MAHGKWDARQASVKVRDYYESRGDIVREVQTDEKVIALTFDDGPDPVTTLKIIDVLSAYHAKSTFFVLGKCAAIYPDILRKIVEQGHEIANHTYTHLYMSGQQWSTSQLDDEIMKTEQAIVTATGERPRLFRPPGGHCNVQAMRTIIDKGYKIILWSGHQDTEDWTVPGVAAIVGKVLENARNGDIVLFHDRGKGADQTAEALAQILPAFVQRGFRFVTVSELIQLQSAK